MNVPHRRSASLAVLFVFPFLLLSFGCGSSTTGTGGGTPPPAPTPRIDVTLQGSSTFKVRSNGRGTALISERPVSIFTQGPLRGLYLVNAEGGTRRVELPADWHLLDFAQHPSGDISVILSTARHLRLLRISSTGTTLADAPLSDREAAHDPYISTDLDSPHDADSMQPIVSRDAARIAPLGEDLAIAVRTGLHAVVAYRYRFASRAYLPVWRTLVEPGTDIGGRFLTSGSHDVMGQLENHLRVLIDTDGDNALAVAVNTSPFDSVAQAHTVYFRELVPATPGVLVTRLSPDGRRLGTTAIDHATIGEAHGLRAVGGTIAVAGRVRTERREDGTGWNAYLALVSSASRSLRSYRVFDIDRGDVLFDVMADGRGGYLAAGSTGYTQNPTGASISEEAQPLLLRLNSEGETLQRLFLPAASGHNSVRSLASGGGGVLFGGMQNGPGTHTYDSAPDKITANGFLREMN